jgi:hypothetical protein
MSLIGVSRLDLLIAGFAGQTRYFDIPGGNGLPSRVRTRPVWGLPSLLRRVSSDSKSSGGKLNAMLPVCRSIEELALSNPLETQRSNHQPPCPIPCSCREFTARSSSLQTLLARTPGSLPSANVSSTTVKTLGPSSSNTRQVCVPWGPVWEKSSSNCTICLRPGCEELFRERSRRILDSLFSGEALETTTFRATYWFSLVIFQYSV